jgi:amidase
VVDFKPPFDSWEALRTTVSPSTNKVCLVYSPTFQFDVYYQGGAGQTLAALAASGEPPIPAFADLLKTFNVRQLPASEILQVQYSLLVEEGID